MDSLTVFGVQCIAQDPYAGTGFLLPIHSLMEAGMSPYATIGQVKT